MPKASELKRGVIVEINNTPHAVKTVEAKSPSSRGASTLYKIRFTNLQTGQKLDESYKGDDLLKEAYCQRRQVQYSYNDGEHYVFMDQEDYSQYEVRGDELTEEAGYLTEGLDGIIALLSDENCLVLNYRKLFHWPSLRPPPVSRVPLQPVALNLQHSPQGLRCKFLNILNRAKRSRYTPVPVNLSPAQNNLLSKDKEPLIKSG